MIFVEIISSNGYHLKCMVTQEDSLAKRVFVCLFVGVSEVRGLLMVSIDVQNSLYF